MFLDLDKMMMSCNTKTNLLSMSPKDIINQDLEHSCDIGQDQCLVLSVFSGCVECCLPQNNDLFSSSKEEVTSGGIQVF